MHIVNGKDGFKNKRVTDFQTTIAMIRFLAGPGLEVGWGSLEGFGMDFGWVLIGCFLGGRMVFDVSPRVFGRVLARLQPFLIRLPPCRVVFGRRGSPFWGSGLAFFGAIPERRNVLSTPHGAHSEPRTTGSAAPVALWQWAGRASILAAARMAAAVEPWARIASPYLSHA